MSRSLTTFCLEILLLMGLFGGSVSAQPQLAFQPRAAARLEKQRGIFDYALGKVNHDDRNYGALGQALHESVVQQTVDNLYFWSNVVSLVLLAGAVSVILLQWHSADKRELIAASVIAQLWNARISDRFELDRRTEKFNQLVAIHNAQVERSLTVQTQSATASGLKRRVETLDQTSPNMTSRSDEDTRVAANTADYDAARPHTAAVGLQQRNIRLERQVEAMKNTEANLRKRLNDAIAQLEQERNRNQALKGA